MRPRARRFLGFDWLGWGDARRGTRLVVLAGIRAWTSRVNVADWVRVGLCGVGRVE